ncbi:MAG TPA: HAD family hydrolase [Terriglobales bacterium]|jgi:D-glycero-D-manno-heptose 1,7-bisphosphate phosphatase|nr:HAD family hydrolase [Terriglobales bacterium]
MLFSELNKSVRRPAIFIDRDGVINLLRPSDYVLDWSQFVFVPGIREALKQLASLGLPMIVISNQAAVGKGLLDTAGLEGITSKMYQELAHDGTFLTAAYYCPHRPDENCPCRKPKPALLQAAAADFNIDLTRSVFIGDSDTDVEAAHAAGCKPVLFGIGVRAVSDSSARNTEVPVATTGQNLLDVVSACLQGVQTC